MAGARQQQQRATAVGSTEDLSEYTDADESISAPTEFLAEFLSAVMLQDYETALKYCKLILQYEPNNATAKEFYPLIVEKLAMIDQDSDSSSSNDNDNGDEQSDSDATTASYSSLEDDGTEDENLALRLTRRFPTLDIANGNASDEDYPNRWISVAQQRLEEAIKQKVEKNRKLLANRVSNIGTRTSDWQDISPDCENTTDFMAYSGTKEAERSPDEEWVQFNSDSESPSDPFSQLTFQEAARR